jgi:hypothetical protein
MPDFLIIGAQKSGTTALHYALKQHPQIAMHKQKEPEFFTYEGIELEKHDPAAARWNRWICTELPGYLKGFEGADPAARWGEASTVYLNSYRTEETAENIRKYIPDVRLIAILRNPAERAYSAYNFNRQLGLEPISDFKKALELEDQRIANRWHRSYWYFHNGLYAHLLQPYFRRFPRKNMRIYLYEEWVSQPQSILRELFQFLEIDDQFLPDYSSRQNQTFLVRSISLHGLLERAPRWLRTMGKLFPFRVRNRLVRGIRQMNQFKPPPLDSKVRTNLLDRYRDDLLELQTLLDCDLQNWL